MLDDIERTVLTKDQIQDRVIELGAQISADYGDEPILLVAVLRGATMFIADLARSISAPLEIDFMAVSSYGSSTKSSGVVRIIKDLEETIEGRHVLVVEDILDTGVTAAFLVLVSTIVCISVREWILLLARKRLAELRESDPVWLPDYAVTERKPLLIFSLLTLAFALAKELSGEAQLERAQKQVCECDAHVDTSAKKIYVETTEQRFNGVRRCC
jgi:hypoxanthine phosphoribosyltransferase